MNLYWGEQFPTLQSDLVIIKMCAEIVQQEDD